MKKTVFRILAGTMAIAMALTLSACGENNSSSAGASSAVSSSEVSSSAEESSSEVSSEASTSSEETSGLSNTSGTYASVEEFLEDPNVSGPITEMMSSLATEKMSIDIKGEGDVLVYLFTYSDTALEGNDIETVATTLETEMSAQAATFENIADQVASVLDSGKATVRVVYAQADGSEIFSQDFNSK